MPGPSEEEVKAAILRLADEFRAAGHEATTKYDEKLGTMRCHECGVTSAVGNDRRCPKCGWAEGPCG